VDTEKLPALMKRYGITAMPTFSFIKNKEVVDTIKGADKEGVRAAVVKHMQGLAPVASTSGTELSDVCIIL
jgi:thioredoxin 1